MSTALHDFQGLGVLEGMQRGCLPVVPDRVAYPEYVPPILRYPCGTEAQEASALADRLQQVAADIKNLTVPAVEAFECQSLLPAYEQQFQRLMQGTCRWVFNRCSNRQP